jgi:hypothetical protein
MNERIDHEKMTRNAVIYCRVSSTKQRLAGSGLGKSGTALPRLCRGKRNIEVEAVFPDDVSGGGDFMQPPWYGRAAHLSSKLRRASLTSSSSMISSDLPVIPNFI